MFTVQGAIWFGMTLSFLKVVQRTSATPIPPSVSACGLPTMGLALLVMVPVLYTDVNESWKLTARRQRVAIGIAGVTAELCCAAIAMCVWGFLPNGPGSAAPAFMVATSTWDHHRADSTSARSSHALRYDGYYVLSDWLETPNLHNRSFRRWRGGGCGKNCSGLAIRRRKICTMLPRRRLLVCFAYLTWIYRFSLFLGIAAIVYHFAVKALGVAMMAVEIGYFLIRPVVSWSSVVWWRRRLEIHLLQANHAVGDRRCRVSSQH